MQIKREMMSKTQGARKKGTHLSTEERRHDGKKYNHTEPPQQLKGGEGHERE